MTENAPHRLYLREDQIPAQWYNLRADMPEKPEPIRLPNGAVATPEDLAPVFCDELVRQELDDDTAYFDIPEPVREMYRIYRPSPLCRAYNLERALGTPAKIYYKFEGNNTSGSHKLNSAVAQAYYAKAQELTGLTTETGAGQWGTALAEAGRPTSGSTWTVFMVKCSYEQKPFRRNIMEHVQGADVTPSPSATPRLSGARCWPTIRTPAGVARHAPSPRPIGARPEHSGEQGALHAGLGAQPGGAAPVGDRAGELRRRFEELGAYPDVVIGCAGGGSNLGGLIAPFM